MARPRRTLVRHRPLVLVSSSITGLTELRAAIKNAIEALELADAWLFEFSFVSAGSPPSSQYLQVAKDCDLCVILVADPPRQGTIDEYEEASRDNPAKILGFFVGPDSASPDPFRKRLRQHTVKGVDRLDDLPAVVADAVAAHLETGELVRDSLTSRLVKLELQRRALVGLPVGFAFSRMLDAGGASLSPENLVRVPRVILSGPAGSGKSDTAIGALIQAGSERGPLPLYLLAGPGKRSLLALIESAFDTVRFVPGESLIRQFQRDGRIVIVVDGLDELDPDNRDVLLADIERSALEFPRTRMTLLLRFPQPDRLASFARWRLYDLGPSDLDALFAASGTPESTASTLDSRLLDLARRPFWAALVARHGHTVRSGPELLDRLVADRLNAGLIADDFSRARARAAVEDLALRARPAAVMPLDRALRDLGDWSLQREITATYATLPAATQLDQLCQTGIVELLAGSVVFAHPLLAAYLAACRASALGSLPRPAIDPDFWPLLGARLAERSPDLLVDLLTANDVFTIASVARLAGDSLRVPDESSDLDRLNRALLRFGHLAGDAAIGQPLGLFVTPGYVCMRQAKDDEPLVQRDGDFGAWIRRSGSTPSRAICWRGSPFARATPEVLAARIVLLGFKESVQRLKPKGRAFGPYEWDHGALTSDRGVLAGRVLSHVRARANARHVLCAALGLAGSALDSIQGEPHVMVGIGSTDARFSVSWGNEDAQVDVHDEELEWTGDSVRELLADPAAVEFADFSRQVEDRLGSALGTQAVRRPSAFEWTL